ncbi:MAG TPA: glycosyltransferase family 39 protein [Terriglobales bacterium]
MSSAVEQQIQTPSSSSVSRIRSVSRDQYRALVALITLVAAFLRFWQLGTRGFMIDEGFSWAIARSTWPDFFYGIATRTADMTLHYFLLHLWSELGQSEFALRSISALFGIATIPVVAELGKRLYSRNAGLIAASLLTVHIFAIKFSQEIRAYPMVMFFAALGWLQLTRIVRDPSHKNWFYFSLISLLAIYSHFIAGLNLIAQMATLFFLPVNRVNWRRVFESLGVTFLGLIPALIYTFIHKGDLSWIKHTDKAILTEFFDSIAGRTFVPIQMYGVWALWGLVVVLFAAQWKRQRSGFEVWAASIPVTGTALPFILLVTVAAYQPIFVPRYIAYVLLPFLLGIAWMLSRFKPAIALVSTAILIAIFAWHLPAYYREPSWQDFRGAVAYVGMRHQPGDAIVVWEPMARPAVEYYGSRIPGFPEFLYPRSGNRFHAEDMMMVPDPFTLPPQFAQRRRIWIVFDLDKSPEEYNIVPPLFLERVIGRTHKMISFRQFQNVRVEEFEKTEEQSTTAN